MERYGYYFCLHRNGITLPLTGPLKCEEVIALVNAQPKTQQWLKDRTGDRNEYFCNVSRYDFKKSKLYPYTKAGDVALLADMLTNFVAIRPAGFGIPISLSGDTETKKQFLVPAPQFQAASAAS